MKKKLKIAAILPARYESSRLAGKMVADLNGEILIDHVYSRVNATGLFDTVQIAIDDERIRNASRFADSMILTGNHGSGTARIQEVSLTLDSSFDYIVNIQGDEALITNEHLGPLVTELQESEPDIASLYTKNTVQEEFQNPNVVKVVLDDTHNALYFSRAPIPHDRQNDFEDFNQHVGVYAFKKSILDTLDLSKSSILEQTEKLEQLTWLSKGLAIKMIEVRGQLIGIDTLEDLEQVRELLKN